MIRSLSPEASIVITTRNRKDDVLRAIASCIAQRGVTLEVLVYDDASDDETVEAIRSAWPQCRVFESVTRTGYIVNRNRGFRDAQTEFVFSLDDDAYFTSPDTVSDILRSFDAGERIAAVAIPYIEPRDRRSLSSLAKSLAVPPGTELRSYIGCAHAVRREPVLALNGYREFFVHQHEERELCLRLRAAGWRIVYGQSAPVVHMVSANRDQPRITFYAGRNQILSETLNAPFPDVVPRLIRTSIGLLRYRFSWGDLLLRVRAIRAGLRDSIRYRHLRRSIKRSVYRKHRQLPAHGAMSCSGPVPLPCHESIASNHSTGAVFEGSCD